MSHAQAFGIFHFRLQAGGEQPGSGGGDDGAGGQGGVRLTQERDFHLLALGRAFLGEVRAPARSGDGAGKAEFAKIFRRFGREVAARAAGVFQGGADFFRRLGVGVVDRRVVSGLDEARSPSRADDSAAQTGDGFAGGAGGGHCLFSTPIFFRAWAGVMMLNPERERMSAAFSVSCALVARTPFFR